jgi:hypothetical protein
MTANVDNNSKVHYPNFFKWEAEERRIHISIFVPQTGSCVLIQTHWKDSYMTTIKLKYVAQAFKNITKYF